MEKKLGILFDLDGTLLNTLEDLADATNYTLRYFGCPERSLAEVRKFVGNGVLSLMTQALPGREDDPDPQELVKVFKTYYEGHSQIKTRPYDGIPEAIAKVAECYPVAIVSNKPDGAVQILCAEYFPGYDAVGERAGTPRKPAPDMVYRTMEALGVESCIYVGDSEVDVLTAQNAKVPCLTVLWGFRDRELLEELGAKHFCYAPEQLPECIQKLAEAL